MARDHNIDQLRGLCILAVLANHLGSPGLGANGNAVFALLGQSGYYGVAIFFVISGFLITSNVIVRYGAPQKVSVTSFYVMRASRIVPCLLLLLTVGTALNLSGLAHFQIPQGEPIIDSWIAALTFRFNYFFDVCQTVPAWVVLWSLSIEEQFYLLCPLVFVALRRREIIIAFLIALIIVCPLFRLDVHMLYRIQGCADLLAMGVLAAIIARSDGIRALTARYALALRALGLLVMFLVCYHSHVYDNHVIGPTLVGLGAATFLIGSGRDVRQSRWNPLRLLQLMGRCSYELYLFHLTVAALVFDAGDHLAPRTTYILSIGLAVFVNACWTEPLNRWLRYWLKAAAARVVAAGGRASRRTGPVAVDHDGTLNEAPPS